MVRLALWRWAVILATGLTVASANAGGPVSVSDVAAPLLDSVVNISTSKTVESSRQGVPIPEAPEGSPFQEFFDDFFSQNNNGGSRPRRVQSLGSGFVIDASGIIITNNHVIADADVITAIFNDGTELIATVIGRDEKTDIAVLKVEPAEPLTAVDFGDSTQLRVGDWVMAIGNPFGLGGSVTLGIVSARNRDIDSGPYDNFIQTDAAINRGNSGGPLFDMDGKVVGINTAIISPSGGSIGIGFAVPAEIAVGVIDQLQQFGETRRGWLGVRIQQISDEMAEGLQLASAHGALVAGVTPDGPAEVAGIEAGDVIIEFNGSRVGEMNDLPRMVAERPIGERVSVLVVRKGEETSIEVTLGWLEDAERIAVAVPEPEPPAGDQVQPASLAITSVGLHLSDISDQLREDFEIVSDIGGVLVTAVEPGGPAEAKRIRPGDIIVEVAQERVATAADVAARIEVLIEEGRRSIRFVLANKDGALRFAAVTISE